jgi:hypothetical protein
LCIEKLIVLPNTFIKGAIGRGIGALPVPFVILPFTDVFIPCPLTIGTIGSGALPVPFAILPFTDVRVLGDSGTAE